MEEMKKPSQKKKTFDPVETAKKYKDKVIKSPEKTLKKIVKPKKK